MKSFVLLVAVAACAPTVRDVRAPADPGTEAAVTAMWANEIRGVARDGDWLLGSAGDELTLAAMFDAHGAAAIAGGGAMPLEALLGGVKSIIVLRPANMTAEDQALALGRAYGAWRPDMTDGATLVYQASQTEARTGTHEETVTPADLMKYGEVIYWSGKRDDIGVRGVASERGLRTPRTAIRP